MSDNRVLESIEQSVYGTVVTFWLGIRSACFSVS